MTTKELVENFYTTFAGNKFEASMCKVKEVDGKVAPYFMEDWIEDKLKELEASIRKEVVEYILENLLKKARETDYADRTEYDVAYDFIRGMTFNN